MSHCYTNGEGTLTTASLGDPINTPSSTASNVTLNLPGIPLRSVSGNTCMGTRAVLLPTKNCPSLAPSGKKASPTQN